MKNGGGPRLRIALPPLGLLHPLVKGVSEIAGRCGIASLRKRRIFFANGNYKHVQALVVTLQSVDGELSPAERAEMRAGECRRRQIELSSGDPITAADVEIAAQHAAEAKVYADQAKKESAKVALWLARLRSRSIRRRQEREHAGRLHCP